MRLCLLTFTEQVGRVYAQSHRHPKQRAGGQLSTVTALASSLPKLASQDKTSRSSIQCQVSKKKSSPALASAGQQWQELNPATSLPKRWHCNELCLPKKKQVTEAREWPHWEKGRVQDPEPKDSAASRRQKQMRHLPTLEEPRGAPRAGDGRERGGEGACSHIFTSSHSFSLMSTRKSAKVKGRDRYNLKGREKEGGLEFHLVPTHREGANSNTCLKCLCEPCLEVETLEICTADRQRSEQLWEITLGLV